MNEKFANNMDRMTKNMDKLTDSIADGFSLLRTTLTTCKSTSTIVNSLWQSLLINNMEPFINYYFIIKHDYGKRKIKIVTY